MPTRKNGFSLVELQVSLLIASILILSIGMIAQVSTQKYNQYLDEARIYNDIAYGFKMIENRIRESQSLTIAPLGGVQWKTPMLQLGNNGVTEGFAIYQANLNAPFQFVRVKNINDLTDMEVLYSSTETTAPQLTFSPEGINPYTITLAQTTGNNRFNFSAKVKRRVR